MTVLPRILGTGGHIAARSSTRAGEGALSGLQKLNTRSVAELTPEQLAGHKTPPYYLLRNPNDPKERRDLLNKWTLAHAPIDDRRAAKLRRKTWDAEDAQYGYAFQSRAERTLRNYSTARPELMHPQERKNVFETLQALGIRRP